MMRVKGETEMGFGKRRNSRLHLHLDCLHEQFKAQIKDEPVQHGDVDFEVAKPCDLNEVLATVSEAMRLKTEGLYR